MRDLKSPEELNATLRLWNDLTHKIAHEARQQGHPAARQVLEAGWISDAVVEALPPSQGAA